MILKGNQRANGRELTLHLLNVDDNEHCTVHELRGFLADDLAGALKEAEAIALGTKCQQYLFSGSFNPPPDASVSIEEFERAIDAMEARLGLAGQPRAIVFHEKNGRRHAHCVWSRIKIDEMKAINLPFYKDRMMQMSRDLYRKQDWAMPPGLQNPKDRDPDNYSHAEAGQAKRAKRDPAQLKALFRTCWESSDSQSAFAAALREQGFVLARGDRRGFVAVDADGEIYSLSRWCGVKVKDMRACFGSPADLSTVDEALTRFKHDDDVPRPLVDGGTSYHKPKDSALRALVARQREERNSLKMAQEQRQARDRRNRAAMLPKGLRGVWDRLSGRHQKLLAAIEIEAKAARVRDRQETDALIARHLAERQALTSERIRTNRDHDLRVLFEDTTTHRNARAYAPDPSQALILPTDDALFTQDELKQNPARVLDVLSARQERFTRSDLMRKLAAFEDDPLQMGVTADTILRSDSVVRFKDENGTAFYSTRDYEEAKAALLETAHELTASEGFAVSDKRVERLIRAESAKLHKRYGSALSTEQVEAIRSIMQPAQLCSVVGFAGAGKSTLLSVAKQAWEQSGYRVYGAALSGKAADGLQSSSGIRSRTLASLEASWKSDYEPVGAGDIVVIDEAGMVGTRQLNRISAQLAQRGCKLVLIGDPEQLQPIEAGTPFKDIVDQTGAARITEIRRQREDWQRRASQSFALGKTADAFDAYQKNCAVNKSEDGDQAITQLVEDYLRDIATHGSVSSRLALAHRRKDVHAINQSIKAGLRSKHPDIEQALFKTDHGQRLIGGGDRILFTRNDAVLEVKNGMLGTVKRISGNRITVALDADGNDKARDVSFNAKTYSAFDHGFAVSIHRAQGCTVDRSFVLSSTTLDRHLAYVAMTRHRNGVRFYTAPDIESRRLKREAHDRDRRQFPLRSRKRTF